MITGTRACVGQPHKMGGQFYCGVIEFRQFPLFDKGSGACCLSVWSGSVVNSSCPKAFVPDRGLPQWLCFFWRITPSSVSSAPDCLLSSHQSLQLLEKIDF